MIDSDELLDDAAFDAWTPQVRAGATVRRYGDELVAWTTASTLPARLDPLSAVVFQLVDGGVTIGELTADVHEVVGVPPSVARDQLRRVLATFDGFGLLTTSTPSVDDGSPDVFPAPPNP